MMTTTTQDGRFRLDGIRLAGLGGLMWNAYGLVQFAGALGKTEAALVAQGLTPEQAAVMAGLPGWMTLAFGLGVVGGLAGSAALVLRHRAALPVLALSLAAYVVLWLGDLALGVLAVMGAPQVAILTLVVAMAVGLLAVARRAHPAR